MRKALFSLTILAGLAGAGVASAQPVWVPAPPPGYGYAPVDEWRAREWRHHEWERHRRWEEWRHFHHWRDGDRW